VTNDEKYMLSALKLAARGIGAVEPNPAVGCVVVKGGQTIGKGWHEKFGGPHAEINALNDCRSLGVIPKGGTMYVTLEPCCHIGKTGACTRVIIEAGIAKVAAAVTDPSAHASGKGFEQLRQAGIEVEVGVCEQQAKLLNAPFMKFASTGKTWVILKWAQSLDGKLAYADRHEEWVSCEASRNDAHKLRNRAQAILVGIGTVLADDPLLAPKGAGSKDKKLTRIVMDSHMQIPINSRLVKTAETQPVVIVTYIGSLDANSEKRKSLEKAGVEILSFGDLQGKSNIAFVLDELGKRGIQQLLVEGGPKVLASFLREGLADELCVYVAPKILGGTGTADIAQVLHNLAGRLALHHVQVKTFAGDTRISGLTDSGLKSIGFRGSSLEED
jgi:diaminohydroxyphosphoribosylaminopyrimidine deaminase/5-amino-6-(5-phosphoribosylamino)uracil reductase